MKKDSFVYGFISVAHEDAIQTLIDQDPNVDWGFILDDQAKKSLQIYAIHMFELLDKNFNLSDKMSSELWDLGSELYIAAVYDPSYTFLDNEEGLLLLDGNRIDISFYTDDIEKRTLGVDFNNY